MKIVKMLCVGLAALSVTVLAGTAQAALIHAYDLTNSFNDIFGGPALTHTGALGPSGYSFSAGDSGLTLSNALPSSSTYTIEMNFELDTARNNNAWSDVLNFHNSDDELYVYCGGSPDHGVNTPCTLQLYPYTGAGGISSGVFTDMIFSRDGSTNLVQAWLNGTQIITDLADPSGFGIFSDPNNIIRFFKDDPQTTSEDASGTVTSIKIYDQVYTPTNIPSDLPEPDGLVTMLSGLGALVSLLAIGGLRQKQLSVPQRS